MTPHGSAGCLAALVVDQFGGFYKCACGWRSDAGTGLGAARVVIAEVLQLVDCGQGLEPGCCSTCEGSGYSGEEVTGGRCSDCRGTGHAHGPVDERDLPQFIDAVRRAALGGPS